MKRLSDLFRSAVFWVYGKRTDLQQRWIGWRVERGVKAGKYDDPITTRRRLARAARGPEDMYEAPAEQAKVRTEWLRRAPDERG